MNILGVGPQIFIIAFLALLLFGPKKMIQYAYQAGRYVAQLRAMWEQTAQAIQKEFEEAGLNVPPEILNGRFDIGAEAMKIINHSPTVPTVAPSCTHRTHHRRTGECVAVRGADYRHPPRSPC